MPNGFRLLPRHALLSIRISKIAARFRRIFKSVYYAGTNAVQHLRPRRIVVCFVWKDFELKALAIADVLRRHGLPAVAVRVENRASERRIKGGRDLYVGFWNLFPREYLPRSYVFFNAEPLVMARWKDDPDWFAAMNGALEIWGYTRETEVAVANLRPPFRYVPFGYAPYYESAYRVNVPTEVAEDIDVLFFGEVTPRRQRVLDALASRGLSLQIASRDQPLHGAALDRMIARARVIVAVYSFDDERSHVIDYARLDRLLSNGRFVVHEQPCAASRDPGFEQVVTTATYANIADACVSSLMDESARRIRAAAAREWFIRERSLAQFLPLEKLRSMLDTRSTK